MQDLSIPELREGSSGILNERLAALERLPTASYFKSEIEAKLAALAALPEAITRLPLAELLKLLDVTHDRWIRASHWVLSAAEACPTTPEALQRSIETIRERYVSGLDETRAPYAVEAAKARQRGETLAGDEALLRSIPTPDGQTLFAWLASYVEAGKEIGGGLSNRADKLGASGDASRAGALRSELIGLYGELRGAIRLQLKAQPALPRTLEADILGQLDEFQRLAVQRRKKGTPADATTTTTNA